MDYQDVASSKVTGFFSLKHKMIHYFAIHFWKRDFMDKGQVMKSTNIDPPLPLQTLIITK